MKQVFDHQPTSRNFGSLKALLASTPHLCQESELATKLQPLRHGQDQRAVSGHQGQLCRVGIHTQALASTRRLSPPGESVMMRKVRDQPGATREDLVNDHSLKNLQRTHAPSAQASARPGPSEVCDKSKIFGGS